MNHGDFTKKLLQVLGKRIEKMPDWTGLSAVFAALRNEATAATGSCVYVVDGQRFCIDGVTNDECTQLGGDFSATKTCAQRLIDPS